MATGTERRTPHLDTTTAVHVFNDGGNVFGHTPDLHPYTHWSLDRDPYETSLYLGRYALGSLLPL